MKKVIILFAASCGIFLFACKQQDKKVIPNETNTTIIHSLTQDTFDLLSPLKKLCAEYAGIRTSSKLFSQNV